MKFYEDLNIYELRDIARKIGVKNPTTKKRDVLVKEIEQIKRGELQPYFSTTKQGRPAKNLNLKIVDLEKYKISFQNEEKERQDLIKKQIDFLIYFKHFTKNMYDLIDDLINNINEILK